MSAPDETTIALIRRCPWLTAKEESMWVVSGAYPNGAGEFEDCLARVVPGYIVGPDRPPSFEVMVWGSPLIVPASAISKGRELILVHADDPRTAHYVRDQEVLDHYLS